MAKSKGLNKYQFMPLITTKTPSARSIYAAPWRILPVMGVTSLPMKVKGLKDKKK